MYVLLGSMLAMNAYMAFNFVKPFVVSVVSDATDFVVGPVRRKKMEVMANYLKVVLMRKLGYYGSISEVFLMTRDGKGPMRRNVTRQIRKIDPDVCKSAFITNSGFFFHELALTQDSVLEVHGLDEWGMEYRFILDWDSEVAVPLKCNLDNPKLVDKKVINATAVYGKYQEDVTRLVRMWTRCCGIERVLPFLGRDIFRASDTLKDAVVEAKEDDRFELHVMYHDLSTDKLSIECDAQLLIYVN